MGRIILMVTTLYKWFQSSLFCRLQLQSTVVRGMYIFESDLQDLIVRYVYGERKIWVRFLQGLSFHQVFKGLFSLHTHRLPITPTNLSGFHRSKYTPKKMYCRQINETGACTRTQKHTHDRIGLSSIVFITGSHTWVCQLWLAGGA